MLAYKHRRRGKRKRKNSRKRCNRWLHAKATIARVWAQSGAVKHCNFIAHGAARDDGWRDCGIIGILDRKKKAQGGIVWEQYLGNEPQIWASHFSAS